MESIATLFRVEQNLCQNDGVVLNPVVLTAVRAKLTKEEDLNLMLQVQKSRQILSDRLVFSLDGCIYSKSRLDSCI
jgi:hypothetical protein